MTSSPGENFSRLQQIQVVPDEDIQHILRSILSDDALHEIDARDASLGFRSDVIDMHRSPEVPEIWNARLVAAIRRGSYVMDREFQAWKFGKPERLRGVSLQIQLSIGGVGMLAARLSIGAQDLASPGYVDLGLYELRSSFLREAHAATAELIPFLKSTH